LRRDARADVDGESADFAVEQFALSMCRPARMSIPNSRMAGLS
jgi:hypothetical protein